MIARAIESERQKHGRDCVAHLCQAAGLSRAAFYRLRSAPATESEGDVQLRGQIQAVALAWPAYGYRRITAEVAAGAA